MLALAVCLDNALCRAFAGSSHYESMFDMQLSFLVFLNLADTNSQRDSHTM
jgi:hypothetical protein